MEDISNLINKNAGTTNNALNNGRFSNRAARFYWADDEPSPQRAYSIQQIGIHSSNSQFEESPLVIAAISAGVIGVAIIIIILVGIWIRSRLFSEGESRSRERQNNMSVRSSTSTLDEDTYVVCMEMNGAVLGGVHKDEDNFSGENSTVLEMESDDMSKNSHVPEILNIQSNTSSCLPDEKNELTIETNENINPNKGSLTP